MSCLIYNNKTILYTTFFVLKKKKITKENNLR